MLNLSNNNIETFDAAWIWRPRQSRRRFVLSVQNNSFGTIELNFTQNTDIILLETTDYRLCCIFTFTDNCNHLKPWYVSCVNLLPSQSMQVSLVVVSFLLLLANLFSIISQIVSVRKARKIQKKNPGARPTGNCFEMVVICLNGYDILFGVYLCIIWISSFVHKNFFILKEEWWRGHIVCFTAFALVLMFSITSPVFLLLLPLMRLRVISKPMSTSFKHAPFVGKWLSFICTLALSLAFILTLLCYLLHTSLPFNLCLPFIDPTNSLILLKVLVALITILQLVCSVLIAIIYFLLVKEKDKTQMHIPSSTSTRSDKGMIVQLIVVTLSNIVCWFPSGIIYVISAFQDRYPIDMVIWVTVSVLPINSIVNPIVFTATTLRKMFSSK